MTDHETAPELTPELENLAGDFGLAWSHTTDYAPEAEGNANLRQCRMVEKAALQALIAECRRGYVPAPVQSGTTEGLDLSAFDGHTPGPWRAELGAGKYHISTEGGGHITDYVLSDVNARLIAAAPLLLDEVRRLRSLSPSIAPAPNAPVSLPVIPASAVLDKEWAIYEREPEFEERSVLMTFKSEDSAVEYMADFHDDDEKRTVDIVPVYLVRAGAVAVSGETM